MDDVLLHEQAKAMASLLLQLARGLTVPDDDLAAKLPLAQLRVCGRLVDGRRTMSALSREFGVSLSAMTQIADRLERARLVCRVADGADRRIRCLELTERGRRIMRLRNDACVQRMLTLLEHLAADARQDVLAALEKMVCACAAMNGRNAATAKV